MKKVLALLLALCFVAGFAFAEPAAFAPTLSVTGNAKATFGVNLDSKATGIVNSVDGDLTLALVPAASDTKGGAEGEQVYGYIKLNTIKVVLDEDDGTVIKWASDGIDAKVVLGPVYLNVRGDSADTGKYNSLFVFADLNGDGISYLADIKDKTAAAIAPRTVGANVDYEANVQTSVAGGKDFHLFRGVILGLTDTSVVDVKLGMSSASGWNAETSKLYTYATTTTNVSNTTATTAANVENHYNFWASVDLNAVPNLIAGAKVGFGTKSFVQDLSNANAPAFGVKLGYKIGLTDTISLTPQATYDMKFNNTKDFRIGVGALVGLPGAKLDDWDTFGTKMDITPGFGVQWGVDGQFTGTDTNYSDMDLTFVAYDGDLIPVLNVIAAVEFFGITKAYTNAGTAVYVNADFGQVVPYAKFFTTNFDVNTKVGVGADIKVIANTTLNIDWMSGDLALNTPQMGVISCYAKVTY